MLRLKKIRKSKGLTQKEIAEIVGITIEYISYLENNKRKPSFTMLERLSTALDVSISEIISQDTA